MPRRSGIPAAIPPNLPLAKGRAALLKMKEQGQRMLAIRPVAKERVDAWETTTEELIKRTFGSTTDHLDSFYGGHRLEVITDDYQTTEGYLEPRRYEALRSCVAALEAMIEQIDTMISLEDVELDEDTIGTRPPHAIAQEKDDTPMEMDVFISHASADKDLAKAVALLLQVGIGISPERIRCTSVEGYKLELGANVEDQLKIEIRQSRVLIGLLTPASIQSSWVLFELGARWGLGRTELMLGPLLAKGTTPDSIPAPISGINALNANSSPDVHQFVRNIAAKLSRNPPNPAVYHEQIEAVLGESRRGSFLHNYEGRRIKASGARREQYFVHQGTCNHLDPTAATFCDEIGIQMAVAAHEEDQYIHASLGSTIDRNGLFGILRARGLPLPRQSSAEAVKTTRAGDIPSITPTAPPTPRGQPSPTQRTAELTELANQPHPNALAREEKKVLRTLWKEQSRYLAENKGAYWGFVIGYGAPDYGEFARGFASLHQRGLVAIDGKNGIIYLTDTGIGYCRRNVDLIDMSGDAWTQFVPANPDGK